MALMDPQQPHSNTASNTLQFNKGAPQGDDYENKVDIIQWRDIVLIFNFKYFQIFSY